MPVFLRRRSIIALFIALALLLGVIAATAFLVGMQKNDQAAVLRSLEVQVRLSHVFSLLQDAETGQRGYLLTSKPAYLKPYEDAVQAINKDLEALGVLVSDNESHVQALSTLRLIVAEKIAELRETIQLMRDETPDAALALVQTDKGKREMDRAREVMERMNLIERKLMGERQAYSLRTALLTEAGVGAALLLAVILGALTLRDTKLLFAAVADANDALHLANRKIVEESQEKRRLEQQLRQSQKLEAIGQLTGGIAHDFNNMLAVIISSLNLLKRRVERGETDFVKFIESAIDGAERAAVLTHRLLAFARQQPLAPQAVDANKFVAGMSDMMRRTLGDAIKVETVLAGGLWRTYVDPSQLESSILNLAVNGRDAMPDGGKLTIETANTSLDDAYVQQNVGVQAGQYVLVSVTDTGVGMPPEVMAKAFDPFFTTKSAGKGTGLGLSQIFGFVKQSGGHIKIYSELGQGTAIKIYLPRFFGDDAEQSSSVGVSDEPIPMGSADTVVLIVEDEDRMLRLAVETFRDLGYSVLHADGAEKALRIIDGHPEIDLLFTDVVMPDMNGRKLAEQALQRVPRLKVIYTTGFSRNAVIHNGVLDRDVNFLPKPFTLEQLARKVKAVLSGAE
jgi:signal transduction histidine kinase/ActR/RegA family two-component response regulator